MPNAIFKLNASTDDTPMSLDDAVAKNKAKMSQVSLKFSCSYAVAP